jgi:hypothetical protein
VPHTRFPIRRPAHGTAHDQGTGYGA